jgi:hypothetical protein
MVERHQVRLALALRHWKGGPLAIGITAVLCSLCIATDRPSPGNNPRDWNHLVAEMISV